MTKESFPRWASLRHGGMLIAPSRLPTHFPETVNPLSGYLSDRLWRALIMLDSGGGDAKKFLLETVLEEVCGLNGSSGGRWRLGNDIGTKWSFRAITGEIIRPRRLWEGPHDSILPIFLDDEKRLGVGRWCYLLRYGLG